MPQRHTYAADPDGVSGAGETYVVFGGTLGALDAADGAADGSIDLLLGEEPLVAEYPHWADHTLLPHKESEKNRGKLDPARKMEDPREKQGCIGAFCRVYDIEEAIAEFIPDVYVPGDSAT